MAKGILRDLKRARRAAEQRIEARAKEGGLYGSGLSSEGYDGGYLAALADVEAALRGHCASNSRFWPDAPSR